MYLHARETVENGNPVVVLPKNEFLTLRQRAEDYEDMLDLEQAIKANVGDSGIPYKDVRKQFGLR
ncbi:MAG TPA: hypothetical protein VGM92_03705 [Candidatus Kapabacteria bacterium]